MNNKHKIIKETAPLSNYGFSLNPLDYFDVTNPLEYLPVSVLESLGLEGYISERKLKEILDKKSNNYDVLNNPLYTTRNIFQYWSIQYYQLIQQTNFLNKKQLKKIEEFADLLKGYSIEEPENVTNFKLIKETNDYILSLANYILPKEKNTNENIYNAAKLKINLEGTINPMGLIEEKKYKINRSLLTQLKIKRGLIIGLPITIGLGIFLWQRKRK
tara:strand:+ start:445 stop:1092 length:648 start_codon:yes stop_codon:yes gene_type:complete